MFTIEQSQHLLELPKKVQLNGILQDSITITQDFPFQEKYILISPADTEFTFLYEIYQSKKNQFKLSLYLMEEDSRVGLLRVDFSGQHENPQTITDNLPAVFIHLQESFLTLMSITFITLLKVIKPRWIGLCHSLMIHFR